MRRSRPNRLESLPRRKAAFIEPMECATVPNLPDGSEWTFCGGPHKSSYIQNPAPSGSCATRSHSIGSPANVEVLAATNKRALTLVTCFPFNYVGAAPRRFIVRALQVQASELLEQRNGRTSESVNRHEQALVSS